MVWTRTQHSSSAAYARDYLRPHFSMRCAACSLHLLSIVAICFCLDLAFLIFVTLDRARALVHDTGVGASFVIIHHALLTAEHDIHYRAT